ncbi:Uncharacterised protein [Actinomyces howellii]|uniref:Uncharacterized protein n=1 Tax=Actinomyces howellii TaxID=52771 RepID=A0A448HG92_9ACTO|nr:Uncharacterised protein [Actinomyces howellii]
MPRAQLLLQVRRSGATSHSTGFVAGQNGHPVRRPAPFDLLITTITLAIAVGGVILADIVT